MPMRKQSLKEWLDAIFCPPTKE